MSDQDEAYGADEAVEELVTPEAAFKDSANHALNGTKLEPYTIERMWAADSMGLRWGRLSKPAAAQFAKDNTYPGMSGDVGIVIWLCSTTDLDEIRTARRDPSEAEDKAVEFAKKHKIASPKQKQFWEAYKVFLDIMTEVHVAYSEPETEKKTEQNQTTT